MRALARVARLAQLCFHRDMALALVHSDHHITPVRGSARKLDGTPADLTGPSHYPVTAECLECGQPIRDERWLLSQWRHPGPVPRPR
jgi:hypothetical protein